MALCGPSLRRAGLIALAVLVVAPLLAQSPVSNQPGIDLAGIDRSVDPGDDFFRFANGTWDRTTEIPPDRSSWGVGAIVGMRAEQQTRALLEQASAAPSEDEKKVGDYYAAFMDDAAIEARGLTPLRSLLDRIDGIADKRALAQVLGSMLRADVDPLNATNFHTDHLFGLWVAQDFNQPNRNTAYLLQGGLAMPDREYYLADSERMREIRQKYVTHVAKLLTLAGTPADAAAQQARLIVSLETRIAQTHATREQSIDVHRANNPWTRADFDRQAPGLDWSAYFDAANLLSQPAFIVWHPDAIKGEAALVGSEPLQTWKTYLRYVVLNHWSSLLPRAIDQEQFAFFGTTLSGTPQMPPRWRRGVAATSGALGDAVGRLYVQHHFPPESKRAVEAMVADIKAAFAARIERLDWMTPETRQKARAKLEALIVGVGYPDRWRDYSTLAISRDDALGNEMRAEEFDYRQALAKLGAPIDRHEWWMTPQTVNAVNLPIQNALNFPAAILQPPYFDPQANLAHNYGAVGSIIGHEISHSFDDQGSQFDAAGKLENWWTDRDFAHFRQSADRLAEQYSGYKPFPDLAVNGRQTLSENIADVAGLSAAYDAYRLALHGKELAPEGQFTGDQQFFIAFAQSWRQKYREPALRRAVLTDSHAPAMYRAQTVRNLDQWYGAFSIQPDAALYLSPQQRVRVW